MSNLGCRLAASASSRSSILASWKQKTRCAITRRNVHHRRELPYNTENGLGEFLPPAALKTVAIEYQEGLLQRLNDEVRGTAEENKSVAQTVINTALDRSRTLAFNYASLALNNNFFLDHLKPPPQPPATTHEAAISDALLSQIRFDHGNLEQLKSNFSAAALGMASSGWIWFVTDSAGLTAVLPTFGAGTLLVRSRMQVDLEVRGIPPRLNTGRVPAGLNDTFPHSPNPSSPSGHPPMSPASGLSHAISPMTASHSRLFHSSVPTPFEDPLLAAEPMGIHSLSGAPESTASSSSKNGNVVGLGEVLYPLFCLSVHEHAWMSAGYGVWGKEEWLKKFWTVVDWGKVSAHYGRLVDSKRSF